MRYAISIIGNETTIIADNPLEMLQIVSDAISQGKWIEFVMEYNYFKSTMKGPSI